MNRSGFPKVAFHDDLLRQASHLVHFEPETPAQASLRRAVSTAYYALFHFLISEAVANWNQDVLRSYLARAFDHAAMKNASNRVLDNKKFPFSGENPVVVEKLRRVAESFVELQDKRHIADYDNTTVWTPVTALTQVTSAEQAFLTWRGIRHEPIAQAYLVSFLVKNRG